MDLYRIIQEAAANSVKHSRANLMIISLKQDGDDHLVLEVADNGIGTDPDRVMNTGGWGIQGMKDRVAQSGGVFNFVSSQKAGTRIQAHWPI